MAINVLLMGVQGAGKGTQAILLQRDLGIPQISTGDLFRALKKQETPFAIRIKAIMDSGNLVSDDDTNQIVVDRLAMPDVANGAIFDGYPRSVGQAEFLDGLLAQKVSKVDAVVFLNLPREEAVRRIAGRRVNPNDSSDSYNIYTNPPKVEGISDKDGTPLVQRSDDTEEAAMKRIDKFFEQTMPLFDLYRSRGVLFEINANQAIEQVTADIKAALSQATGK